MIVWMCAATSYHGLAHWKAKSFVKEFKNVHIIFQSLSKLSEKQWKFSHSPVNPKQFCEISFQYRHQTSGKVALQRQNIIF